MQIRPMVVKLLRSARYDEASKVIRNFFANESKYDFLSTVFYGLNLLLVTSMSI
jgi:hypothetical protein